MADYGSNSVPSSTHKTYKMYCPCQLKDNFNKETENFNIDQYLFPPLIAFVYVCYWKIPKAKIRSSLSSI